MRRVLDLPTGRGKFALAGAVLLTALVGWADHVSAVGASLLLLYVLAVAGAAWYSGRAAGLFVCFLASAVAMWRDVVAAGAATNAPVTYWNGGMRFLLLLLACLVLVRLKDSLEIQRRLARSDPLTGLLNSSAFEFAADQEFQRARRYGRPLMAAHIDLDGFKHVNADFGHTVGDRALRMVADLIRTNLRRTDLVGRLGGDEFGVILPETEPHEAGWVFDRLQHQFAHPMEVYGWPVTFSVGLAGCSPGVDSLEELFRRAEGLMSDAKRGGGNRIERERSFAEA